MAEVTRKHRAKAHECIYGSIDGEGGSGYGRRYIDWVQAGGKIDHDLQSVAQALANIEAEARSAATQSGGAWVKCSERMPEESALVWFVADGRVYRGFFVCGEFVNSGFFSWAAKDVSHWMPRAPYPPPADPPKGDTDG